MKKIALGLTVFFSLFGTNIQAVNPYISKVYDFMPAPGQFVNSLPEYTNGDTKETILGKVGEQICGNETDGATPGMISLGAFGGYVVFGFDHPIVNVAGEYDFKVYGNAFGSSGSALNGGSCEPGIVSVSYDANGNGLPDDEWYELAGSDYNSKLTTKNYQITYYKPDTSRALNADPDPKNTAITDRTYVKWTTNTDSTGYVMRNSFHTQSYWPQWAEGATLTFTGTKLRNNSVNTGTAENPYYILNFFDWGYVDNKPNATDPGLKIDWAVDSKGKSVNLPSINFVKVHCAVNQYNGWLGECSTEICGGEDLHPLASGIEGVNADNNSLKIISNTSSILKLWVEKSIKINIYNVAGEIISGNDLVEGYNDLDVNGYSNGIYIISSPYGSVKFIKR